MFSLIRLEKSDLKKQEKGIAYRIVEELGVIDRKNMNREIDNLDIESRRKLKNMVLLLVNTLFILIMYLNHNIPQYFLAFG